MEQEINSCRMNKAGEWICPSNPRGMNDDIVPTALPEQEPAAFCVNYNRTSHVASECIMPANAATEEQVKALVG